MWKRFVVLVVAVIVPLVPILALVRQSSSGLSSATDQAERLRPVTGDQLRELSDGQEVLIEGTIDPRTPARFRTFVAYERARHITDNDLTSDIWHVEEQVTPQLWIALADGQTVRVINGYYPLRHPISTWVQSGNSGSSPMRYSGLQIGDRVAAIGALISSADGPVLNASIVAGGTRAEWLADERGLSPIIMDGLLVAGAVLIVIALAAWWLTWHKPHGIAPAGV
ncbi:MAG TPA: hypothetical protein VFF59_09955 [Anaerolineae bacterium]|nr:hypothetical protein [Anaerolineae bacterium]